MTVLTDIPQSGIYLQQGSVFQLIAQITDNNTGLPVQLQTASGMSISVLYPDGVTSQTFTAQLYTDGSDGMIVYTTVSNGTQIDLSQVGLYHFQGNAIIGGVSVPPSYEDDFYVLANVTGNPSPPPSFTSSVLILFDSNGARWGSSVSPSGVISGAVTPSGPSSYLYFNNLIMQDTNGIYWQMAISTIGVISGVQTPGQPSGAIQSFLMSDSNGKSWIITVSTSGTLQAS